jgi:hypothetical protein
VSSGLGIFNKPILYKYKVTIPQLIKVLKYINIIVINNYINAKGLSNNNYILIILFKLFIIGSSDLINILIIK